MAAVNWLVKIHTQEGGAETSVVFVNHCARVIDVSWVGYEGEEQTYGQIAPGGNYEQATFAMHVWKLSFADTREPIAFFLVPQAHSIVEVHGVNQLRIAANMTRGGGAAASTIPTTLVFNNHTPYVLSIRWTESGGAETEYAVLPPGQNCRQDTYVTHVWKAVVHGTNNVVAVVTAPPMPVQVDIQGVNQVTLLPLNRGYGGGV
ncbi:Aste57867_21061 [Aphanomyces stellatus]|uniref:Aste57867_21061 protein n=1 Tax=Aphanomyces stellatus TaxID=120398 RepID=A0A485LHT2_9STRA|nr:hypothetical protein As57867_020993 [Aphanomyces stellatus]VFT97736.1 Aste57867_21061 [Aphanomyces stellatus]